MRTERATAIQLRKAGNSYNDISRLLGVPKSTLATWLRDLVLPQHVLQQLYSRVRSAGTEALVARNKRQTVLAQHRAHVLQQAASKDIGRLSARELRLVGAALYWAEGSKRYPDRGGKRVAFSNADPLAVAVMMRFFREICRVPEDKFRVQLVVAPGVHAGQALEFWSSLTRILAMQFYPVSKQLSRASKRKRPRSRLPYGTVQVRIADTQLFHRMMGWIRGIQDGAAAAPINGAPH